MDGPVGDYSGEGPPSCVRGPWQTPDGQVWVCACGNATFSGLPSRLCPTPPVWFLVSTSCLGQVDRAFSVGAVSYPVLALGLLSLSLPALLPLGLGQLWGPQGSWGEYQDPGVLRAVVRERAWLGLGFRGERKDRAGVNGTGPARRGQGSQMLQPLSSLSLSPLIIIFFSLSVPCLHHLVLLDFFFSCNI